MKVGTMQQPACSKIDISTFLAVTEPRNSKENTQSKLIVKMKS